MTLPQTRATFTVTGANAGALIDQAQRQADALAGVGYVAELESVDIQADMRIQPMGEVVQWRADVMAKLRVRPHDEEPF